MAQNRLLLCAASDSALLLNLAPACQDRLQWMDHAVLQKIGPGITELYISHTTKRKCFCCFQKTRTSWIFSLLTVTSAWHTRCQGCPENSAGLLSPTVANCDRPPQRSSNSSKEESNEVISTAAHLGQMKLQTRRGTGRPGRTSPSHGGRKVSSELFSYSQNGWKKTLCGCKGNQLTWLGENTKVSFPEVSLPYSVLY